jgi:hypothetical protein
LVGLKFDCELKMWNNLRFLMYNQIQSATVE